MEEEQDIYSDIVKRDQLLDAQENKEFDDAVAGGTLEDLRKGVDIKKKLKDQIKNGYIKPIQLDSSQGFEDLQLQFDSAGNKTIFGQPKTVEQRVDDYNGMGSGRIIIKGKTNTPEGIYFYPDNTEANKKTALDLYRAQTIFNAPTILTPLITAGKALGGKYFYIPPKPKQPPMQNVTPARLGLKESLIRAIQPQGKYPKGDNPYLPITDFDLGSIPGMDGQEYAFESRYADELNVSNMTYDELKYELESRAESLGYKVSNVKLNKRRNQFGIDNNISSLYLGHAEAYAKAIENGTKTLEYFPTVIWSEKRFRPKVKNLKGRRYVYFDEYLKRRTNRKLGKSRRDQRIWKQTPEGTPSGTFYREKLAQLRKLNEEELAAGLPRTKLREVDMDHKNALRSVEIYTEGLNKDNEKIVFDLMEKYGLFRGDDARNLILRKKSVHKDLWPKMKAALKKLDHKTRKDFDTEGDYMLYLTVWKNPKTGSTPLREYIETIKFVEEQAAIKTVEEVERILKKSTSNIIAKSPMRDKLIDILGGLESYKSFMKNLMQYPPDVRKEMIIEEFSYIGKSDQIDIEDVDTILTEDTDE